jgi:plastocyanin
MNYSKTNWLVQSVTAAVLAAGIFGAGTVASAADIIGTITLKGTPPPETDLTPYMSANPDCAAMYKGKKMPTTLFYVVGPGGQFADVVVSLKDASGQDIAGKSTGPSAPPALLDQKGCVYTPQILAIQTGQKLLIRNSDNCIHNVDFTPTVPGNEAHNDVQMAGAADLTYTFPKPEMFIMFKCDVHPWMRAWVSVFDNPYFDVSNKDGKFIIKNVPPGKYTVVADHRKLGTQSQVVEVGDKDVTVNFTFTVK